jgi:hypothetical protein
VILISRSLRVGPLKTRPSRLLTNDYQSNILTSPLDTAKMPLIMNAEVDKLNGLAPRACELCHRRDGVKHCAACQAIYYLLRS